MDKIFKALAEPNRVAILRMLQKGERSAGEIAQAFTISQPAVSQHLRALRTAGLIAETREGARRHYRIDARGIAALREFVDHFWTAGLARLKESAEHDHRRAERRPGRGRKRSLD
jgi:DNA-binding transcriptional ArsR family regulator